LLAYRVKKMRAAVKPDALLVGGGLRRAAPRVERAAEALESCRAAAGMQLGPSKLRVPSHIRDMEPGPG